MSVVHLPLRLHPQSRCDAVEAIEVVVARTGLGEVSLDYRVTGRVDMLRLPAAAPPERADGLWKHSCFELFVRQPPSSAYCEFNFSPSTRWAAYRFEGYRSGMSNLCIAPPTIVGATRDRGYRLAVRLRPEVHGAEPWLIGPSAVIEETNGRISYWALVQPPGQPDFHHRDCFAAELPAPTRS